MISCFVATSARRIRRLFEMAGVSGRALAACVLGTICWAASDPAAALHAAYAGEVPKARPGCKPKGLDANEAFAKANGFNGTPVLVRASDGAVLQGYRPASEIRRFLGLTPNKGGQ